MKQLHKNINVQCTGLLTCKRTWLCLACLAQTSEKITWASSAGTFGFVQMPGYLSVDISRPSFSAQTY